MEPKALRIVGVDGDNHLAVVVKEAGKTVLKDSMIIEGEQPTVSEIKEYLMKKAEEDLEESEIEGSVAITTTKLKPDVIIEFIRQISIYDETIKTANPKLVNHLFRNGGDFQ